MFKNNLNKSSPMGTMDLQHEIQRLSPLIDKLEWCKRNETLFRTMWLYYADGCKERLRDIRQSMNRSTDFMNSVKDEQASTLPQADLFRKKRQANLLQALLQNPDLANATSISSEKQTKKYVTKEELKILVRREYQMVHQLTQRLSSYKRQELSKKLASIRQLIQLPLIVVEERRTHEDSRKIKTKQQRIGSCSTENTLKVCLVNPIKKEEAFLVGNKQQFEFKKAAKSHYMQSKIQQLLGRKRAQELKNCQNDSKNGSKNKSEYKISGSDSAEPKPTQIQIQLETIKNDQIIPTFLKKKPLLQPLRSRSHSINNLNLKLSRQKIGTLNVRKTISKVFQPSNQSKTLRKVSKSLLKTHATNKNKTNTKSQPEASNPKISKLLQDFTRSGKLARYLRKLKPDLYTKSSEESVRQHKAQISQTTQTNDPFEESPKPSPEKEPDLELQSNYNNILRYTAKAGKLVADATKALKDDPSYKAADHDQKLHHCTKMLVLSCYEALMICHRIEEQKLKERKAQK